MHTLSRYPSNLLLVLVARVGLGSCLLTKPVLVEVSFVPTAFATHDQLSGNLFTLLGH